MEERKDRVKRESKAIRNALKESFGWEDSLKAAMFEGVDADGGRIVGVDYSPSRGVYLTFEFQNELDQESSSKKGGTEGFEATGASLQPGTMAFRNKLMLFAARLREAGVAVVFHADKRRSRIYERAMKSIGFVSSPEKGDGPGLQRWKPLPSGHADLASGGPILSRLAALEKRTKGQPLPPPSRPLDVPGQATPGLADPASFPPGMPPVPPAIPPSPEAPFESLPEPTAPPPIPPGMPPVPGTVEADRSVSPAPQAAAPTVLPTALPTSSPGIAVPPPAGVSPSPLPQPMAPPTADRGVEIFPHPYSTTAVRSSAPSQPVTTPPSHQVRPVAVPVAPSVPPVRPLPQPMAPPTSYSGIATAENPQPIQPATTQPQPVRPLPLPTLPTLPPVPVASLPGATLGLPGAAGTAGVAGAVGAPGAAGAAGLGAAGLAGLVGMIGMAGS